MHLETSVCGCPQNLIVIKSHNKQHGEFSIKVMPRNIQWTCKALDIVLHCRAFPLKSLTDFRLGAP